MGAALPLSGSLAPLGKEFRDGMMLALEDYRLANGEQGKLVTLTIGDDHGDVLKTANIIDGYLKERFHLFFAPLTDLGTKRIVSKIQKSGKPVVRLLRSGNAGSKIPTVAISSHDQGVILAQFANRYLGSRSATIIADAGDAHESAVSSAFVALFNGKAKKLTKEEYLEGKKLSLSDDIMMIPGSYQFANKVLGTQGGATEYPTYFLGTDLWDSPGFRKVLSPKAKVAFVVNYAIDSPKYGSFADLYQRKYRGEPTTATFIGYSAVKRVLMLFSKLQSNRAEILKKALDQEFSTSLGKNSGATVVFSKKGQLFSVPDNYFLSPSP